MYNNFEMKPIQEKISILIYSNMTKYIVIYYWRKFEEKSFLA